MVRQVLITLFCVLLIALPGCGPGPQAQPAYNGLKISDLAPSAPQPTDRPSQRPMEFAVCFFELPAEHFAASAELWTRLYTAPLRFASSDAFKANGFAAGFGDQQTWSEVSRILQAAQANKARTISMVIFDQQPRDIIIAPLNTEQSVFFTDAGGRIAGVTLSAGATALRISAGKIPTARGLARVNIQLVFKSRPVLGGLGWLPPGEVVFDSAGFELKLSPGQFVLLGPARYHPGETKMTLDKLFCTADEPRQIVRMYLILCRGIVD